MRFSRLFSPTLKESPSDAELPSHKLLLRAGFIHQTSSGVYSYLTLGKRVLRKIENIIREEMDFVASEVQLPSVQPMELWQKSGREDAYGPELLRFEDRHQRPFCYGPTHEEVVTELVRSFVLGHKQLPISLYQIQTKFRDEVRPRFGLMRAREFLMKDAYSFDLNEEEALRSYALMREAYIRIFSRLGLEFCIVLADSGQIGGKRSEEFQLLAEHGEDLLAVSDSGDYSANIEAAHCPPPLIQKKNPPKEGALFSLETKDTEAQINLLRDQNQNMKEETPLLCTLLVKGVHEGEVVALLLSSSDQLNPTKAEKHPHIHSPLTPISEKDLKALSLPRGFIGPVSKKSTLGKAFPTSIKIIADYQVAALSSFHMGSNLDGKLITFASFSKEAHFDESFDLRMIKEGEPSPNGKGIIKLTRGIEVGHIFILGTKYSKAMGFEIQGKDGKLFSPFMGCYGIGVSRIMQAAIEQNHDEKGIVWNQALAPFEIVIAALNIDKSSQVKDYSEHLYQELLSLGIDVALDDRAIRIGEKLKDLELMGFPLVLVVGERGLSSNELELIHRKTSKKESLPKDSVLSRIKTLLTQDNKA